MFTETLATTWETAAAIALSTVGACGLVLVYTRLAGLRSFTQMSGFDFAVNIALGSIVGTTGVSADVTLPEGAVAMGTLFAVQALIATARRTAFARDLVNNRSLLLMDGPDFIEEHLRRGRVTKNDVRFKLREANVFRYEDVRAVVLETTGEISVLHAAGDREVDPDIFADVITPP